MDWVRSNNNDLFLDSRCDVLLMVGNSTIPHRFLYLVYNQVIWWTRMKVVRITKSFGGEFSVSLGL